jgi:hypothetical protein
VFNAYFLCTGDPDISGSRTDFQAVMRSLEKDSRVGRVDTAQGQSRTFLVAFLYVLLSFRYWPFACLALLIRSSCHWLKRAFSAAHWL